MKSILSAVVFSLTLLSVGEALAACDFPTNGEAPNLSLIMRNYGRWLLPAERLIQQGRAGIPGTDADFARAMEGVRLSADCTALVVQDRSGQFYPRKSQWLSGQQRQDYLDFFFALMADFHDLLREYEKELSRLHATPSTQRSFSAAAALAAEIRERANAGHAL